MNNQKIGEKFVKLIDEAFKNYSLFQQNQNISELFAWADEFKLKVKSSIDKWMALAGGEASKLLRSLQGKTDQWWYFLGEHLKYAMSINTIHAKARFK